MNKIFLFCLFACLGALMASDEGVSSPLMMFREFSEQDDDVSIQQERNLENHSRGASGDATPVGQSRYDISANTTAESATSLDDFDKKIASGAQSKRDLTGLFSSLDAKRCKAEDLNKEEYDQGEESYQNEALNEISGRLLEYINLNYSDHLQLAKEVLAGLISANNHSDGVYQGDPTESVHDDCKNKYENNEVAASNKNNKYDELLNLFLEVIEEDLKDKKSNCENKKYKKLLGLFVDEVQAKALEKQKEIQRIQNEISSKTFGLDHHDSIHPLVFLSTIFADGVQYPLLLPGAFGMQRSDCVRAGLAANTVSSLVASPYLQSRVLENLPSWSHVPISKANVMLRQAVDPAYIFYYVPGWYALKLGPVSRIAGLFILPSAIMRKLTWRFFQSEAYRGSLQERAKELTSPNPTMTSKQLAFKDSLERFGPDIVAAITRSFCSNLYDYNEGKISTEQVFIKTAWSSTIYTMATVGFYTLYRFLEVVIIKTKISAAGSYRDFADSDMGKIELLKKSLSLEESQSLINDNSSYSSTNEQVDDLLNALKFLDSPVTNIMGDPLYRWSFDNDQNAIASFRALDAVKLLRTIIPCLKSADDQEKIDAYKAFKILKNYLMTGDHNPDIENNKKFFKNSSFCSISSCAGNDTIFQKKIDTLIKFFKNFSMPSTSTPSGSLLGAAMSKGYGAVKQDEDNESL